MGRASKREKGEKFQISLLGRISNTCCLNRWVEATESRRRLAEGREEHLKLRLAVSDKEYDFIPPHPHKNQLIMMGPGTP